MGLTLNLGGKFFNSNYPGNPGLNGNPKLSNLWCHLWENPLFPREPKEFQPWGFSPKNSSGHKNKGPLRRRLHHFGALLILTRGVRTPHNWAGVKGHTQRGLFITTPIITLHLGGKTHGGAFLKIPRGEKSL